MSQDSNKLTRELKFIETSFAEGIITNEEYNIAKKRIEEKLSVVKREEDEEAKDALLKNEMGAEKLHEGDLLKESTISVNEGISSSIPITESKKEEKFDWSKEKQSEIKENEEVTTGVEEPKEPKESAKVEFYYDESSEKSHVDKELDKESSEKVDISFAPEKKIDIVNNEPIKQETPKPVVTKKKDSSRNMETYGRRLNLPKRSNILIVVSVILLIIIILFSINRGNLPETEFIPVCETSLDCYKQGYFGECLNVSTRDAKCAFELAVPINITVITSDDCILCDITRMKNTLLQLYPGANFEIIDLRDTLARELISNLNIKALPAYIFDKNVDDTKRFDSVKSTLTRSGDFYVMKSVASGSSYFFNNKEIVGQIELFLDPSVSSSIKAFDNAIKLNEIRDINFNVRFYTREKIDSNNPEIYEILRQVCIRDHSEDKFISYLGCIFEGGITESVCSSCLDENNIPYDLIEMCVDNKGKALLNIDLKLAKQMSINTVPVFLINNQYKKGGSLSVDLLEDAFCNINSELC